MEQPLEIKDLNNEDIKFLKKKLNFTYRLLFFFSIFTIVFPFYSIYLIFINPEITDKGFPLLMVVVIFGFWVYVTLAGFKSNLKAQRNLLLQKKIEGNLVVLEKEIITIKWEDANDSYSHEIKVYSEIEKKEKSISLDKKDYDKIAIGNFIWIEYFLDCNYIKTLTYDGQNINRKEFTK